MLHPPFSTQALARNNTQQWLVSHRFGLSHRKHCSRLAKLEKPQEHCQLFGARSVRGTERALANARPTRQRHALSGPGFGGRAPLAVAPAAAAEGGGAVAALSTE